ncbi:MAG TPA: 1-deoxy-D-xylulose-5-phosphate synthase [Pseudonocardiaceae bacterium]|nr:1-deoxy-D-xylulose-5-phosphate synthase [Pseudonocardiaceae bacterium]
MSLLGRITGPTDLKGLSTAALAVLAEEIRAFLIDKVSGVGGHLGPNLGVVELTIAAHRVFDSPWDVLLFDTGHQSYVHKILTGRCAEFDALRQAGGLSGYPSRAESVHDVIENSHASTALSYADGLAKAFAVRGEGSRRVVALVGDGALTGGMCWEALNNIGAAPDRPVIIVLNDNGRSYSPTVGGLARHLAELRQSDAHRHTLFEDLGLAYLGPVDGHDISDVENALRRAGRLRRPVVVHCVTRKGKGYPPAEQDETDCLHTVGVIDPSTGCLRSAGEPTWTSVFAEEITAIGADRDDVVCLTAAMQHPTGLGEFAARFPHRVFDVGIAEQHAVTCAAGLAIGGLHPVVAIYSTFLSRAFDQLIMDVALHQLPVTFVLDRAGITGPDGPSHHGMWDASILPVVPGLRLAAPRDCARLRELLREAVDIADGPTVIRYPKATAGPDIHAIDRIGPCDILRDDPSASGLLVAVGPLAGPCLAAADELAAHDVPVTVIDPRWIAPLDPALLTLAGAHRLVLTVEDTTTTGALGARIAQALAAAGADTCAATYALPPRFLPHASRDQILHAHGLDADGIATAVLKRLASTHRGKVTAKEI